MDEILQTVGASALGVTIGCARCHNHKFDPISQKDYYAMAAALAGVNPGERDLRGMVNGEDAAELNALRTKETHWLKAIATVEDPVRERLLKAAQVADDTEALIRK